jgi:hypothetical protein
MNADSTPATERDARNRALRTFVQGFGLDLAAGATVGLVAGVAVGIEWTQAYWIALGLAVAKSTIQGGVSYLARKFVPPAEGGA